MYKHSVNYFNLYYINCLVSFLLLDNYSEVPLLRGSKSLTLTAHLHTPPDHSHSRPILFPSDKADDCPLDIIVNLMVCIKYYWCHTFHWKASNKFVCSLGVTEPGVLPIDSIANSTETPFLCYSSICSISK